MPAALGHSVEGAESPHRKDLVCLDLAFLGQTEAFSGVLSEPVPWVGGWRQIWAWREIPVWAAVDSKHKSGTVLCRHHTCFCWNGKWKEINLADFSKALGFGVRCSSVQQILILAAGCTDWAVPPGFCWIVTSRACAVTSNMN